MLLLQPVRALAYPTDLLGLERCFSLLAMWPFRARGGTDKGRASSDIDITGGIMPALV